MKKDLRSEKIKKYSLAAGTLVAASAAQGQIVYTDIPDQTVTTGNTYNLDLNNDVSPDFFIGAIALSGSNSSVTYTGVGVGLQTAGSNGAMGFAGSQAPVNYASALNLFDPIDATGNFNSAPTSSSSAGIVLGGVGTIAGIIPFNIGPWLGKTDKYLGLRFQIGSNLHYGWARLDVPTNATSFTIKDYAYESTANTPIGAGATSAVGLNENDLSLHVGFNLTENTLTVTNNSSELTNGKITILNISGQQVAAVDFPETTQFDISSYSSGVYLIQVTFDQGMVTEKLFIR